MKDIDIANRIARNNFFKRVNFKHHVLAVVTSALRDFPESTQDYGVFEFQLSILSNDWIDYQTTQKNEVWNDSITLSLGKLPIRGIRAVVPVKGRTRVLSEEQASLSFFHTLSGDVIALIYPPKSEVSSMLKDAYIIERWSDPLDIDKKKVMSIMRKTLLINIYCRALLFPNRKGLRLMTRLEAKDSVLSNGGSRFWLWIMYIVKTVKGVARLYGVGSPK